ncbi:hypothetical protein EIN_332770 [Entamoeba invadens IP1]|uniref:Leucine rich repeat containing protein BspA family protein n=1 Tax=Entamoeba invadens IP1 TaxID=370355 RepID=A0A0A1TZV2_ENTIV|nr:hypothetical protein EIN_332770 [Entamoeba invadens IP1]ELP85726.1 hypothetical protein EIN_332770 [Entamoeba invadens IP1]|eukprot:XP_004185072.1 hypothetical protein EIN_332770 [Entamoeba invadens IP1]
MLKYIKSGDFEPQEFVAQFPEELKIIGNTSFNNCDFHKIEFGENVKSVGNKAFSENKNLTEIVFNVKGKIQFGQKPFNGAQLTSVISKRRPEEWEIDFGESAFMYMVRLNTFPFPKKVTAFGNLCFANCFNLKDTINVSGVGEVAQFALKVIRNESFENCKKLVKFEMPLYVNQIGYHAFKDCTALQNFKINNNMILLSMGCLCGCTQLQSIQDIPRECFS